MEGSELSSFSSESIDFCQRIHINVGPLTSIHAAVRHRLSLHGKTTAASGATSARSCSFIVVRACLGPLCCRRRAAGSSILAVGKVYCATFPCHSTCLLLSCQFLHAPRCCRRLGCLGRIALFILGAFSSRVFCSSRFTTHFRRASFHLQAICGASKTGSSRRAHKPGVGREIPKEKIGPRSPHPPACADFERPALHWRQHAKDDQPPQSDHDRSDARDVVKYRHAGS